MFPTFTGSSRRPRNVNLSGQRNTNPFAAHGLSPRTGAGASKTVADAQAGRQRRQKERVELKAARTLQRVWRGHKSRLLARDKRHEALCQLYSDPSATSLDQRVATALPLLVRSIEVHRSSDCRLLDSFLDDLSHTDFSLVTSERVPQAVASSLIGIVISALAQEHSSYNRDEYVDRRLDTILRIVRTRPLTFLDNVKPYFRLLVAICSRRIQLPNMTALAEAVITPLRIVAGKPSLLASRVYAEFAMSFLTQELVLLEQHISMIADDVDLDALSRAIIEAYATAKQKPDKPADDLLWLLAHTIDLQGQQKREVPSSQLYLRAIYTQLSALSVAIRVRRAASDASDDTGLMPDYQATQLGSLTDKDEIPRLLDRFTSKQSQTDVASQEYASLLAGYSITLIRCFPEKGDDIRMHLFLADFPTASGNETAVQFFWRASSATQVFHRISLSPKSALDFLLKGKNSPVTRTGLDDDFSWDREWRTVLLFLELYTFVMRLTDDEDFFYGMEDSPIARISNAPTSRLRTSALGLDALKPLSLFLKNLAFTLNYHASALLHNENTASASGNTGRNMPATAAPSHHGQSGTYRVIAGVDFSAFKSLIMASIQMLYERDSRRPFLPADHWLMTTHFDMESFLPAIFLEEQRQHDLQEQGDASDDDNSGNDDSDVDDSGIVEDSLYHDVDEEPMPSASFRTLSRTVRYARMEELRRLRKKAHKVRTLAAIGPKLEILRNMPYALPFELRVNIFRQFVYLDKQRRRKGNVDPDQWRLFMANQGMSSGSSTTNSGMETLARHIARIPRNEAYKNAFTSFYPLGEAFKEPIQITFLDEYGMEEAGIDGGGVTKEFLMSITREVFAGESGYLRQFGSNKENAMYVNPLAIDQARTWCSIKGLTGEAAAQHMNHILSLFDFTGRVVGKCMYEGILLDAAFAGFFLLKWALSATNSGYRASINDLREMDEQLYDGMLQLKNYAGDVSDLGLNFTIEDQTSLDGMAMQTKTRQLMPDGENVAVTNENRPLYMSYVARHRLVAQPYQATKAFLRGLGMIIDPTWVRMFNQIELQRLVSGDSSEIDVQDLRANTVYAGVYEIGTDGEEHPSVQLFWQVVTEMADEDRRLLLKFVTSTPRAPLLGFSQLQPAFSIRDGGNDEERLPSASTCINLLKLPRYSNLETMRKKVLYAVRSNSRFDLS